MNNSVQAMSCEANNGSNEGRLHFGQVVGLRMQSSVESHLPITAPNARLTT